MRIFISIRKIKVFPFGRFELKLSHSQHLRACAPVRVYVQSSHHHTPRYATLNWIIRDKGKEMRKKRGNEDGGFTGCKARLLNYIYLRMLTQWQQLFSLNATSFLVSFFFAQSDSFSLRSLLYHLLYLILYVLYVRQLPLTRSLLMQRR